MSQTAPRRSLIQLTTALILRLMGWRFQGELPLPAKCVLIGAPHTSNWDILYTFLLMGASRRRFRWVAKHTLFRGMGGVILKWLGGIPVRRDARHNFVDQMAEIFRKSERLVLAIVPEGTRSKAEYWKTGFYYIAREAGVPVLMGFVDFSRKITGIGPALIPSGDITADFDIIRAFYSGKTGRDPEKQGPVRLK